MAISSDTFTWSLFGEGAAPLDGVVYFFELNGFGNEPGEGTATRVVTQATVTAGALSVDLWLCDKGLGATGYFVHRSNGPGKAPDPVGFIRPTEAGSRDVATLLHEGADMDPERYWVQMSVADWDALYGGVVDRVTTIETWKDRIFDTIAALKASTGAWSSGVLVRAGVFMYAVAPIVATNADFANAAGTQFYLQASGSVYDLGGLGVKPILNTGNFATASAAASDLSVVAQRFMQRVLNLGESCTFQMPQGRYKWGGAAVINARTGNVERFAIRGDGFAAQLTPTNYTGCFHFELSRLTHVSMRNVTAYGDIVEASSFNHGEIFRFHDTQGNVANRHQVDLENVVFMTDPKTTIAAPPGIARATYCINMIDIFEPRLLGCQMHSDHPEPTDLLTRPVLSDYENLGIFYRFEDCYLVTMRDCRSSGRAYKACEMFGETFEGGSITHCEFAGTKWIGIHVYHPNKPLADIPWEVQLDISETHVKGLLTAIIIENHCNVSIGEGMMIECPNALTTEDESWLQKFATNPIGIRLIDCRQVQITGLQYHSAAYWTDDNDCWRGIQLEGECVGITINHYSAATRGHGIRDLTPEESAQTIHVNFPTARIPSAELTGYEDAGQFYVRENPGRPVINGWHMVETFAPTALLDGASAPVGFVHTAAGAMDTDADTVLLRMVLTVSAVGGATGAITIGGTVPLPVPQGIAATGQYSGLVTITNWSGVSGQIGSITGDIDVVGGGAVVRLRKTVVGSGMGDLKAEDLADGAVIEISAQYKRLYAKYIDRDAA